MTTEKYITIPKLAELLGISRIAVFKRVKKGQIPATKIGRTYVITDQTVMQVLGKGPTDKGKKRIDDAVRKTVLEYGDVLAKLSKE
jgi:excisionase family DNA binding protein